MAQKISEITERRRSERKEDSVITLQPGASVRRPYSANDGVNKQRLCEADYDITSKTKALFTVTTQDRGGTAAPLLCTMSRTIISTRHMHSRSQLRRSSQTILFSTCHKGNQTIYDSYYHQSSTGDITYSIKDVDSGYGEGAKLTWKRRLRQSFWELTMTEERRRSNDCRRKQQVSKWGSYGERHHHSW